MEQHPVPQNVIEVEFKLFGSFTIKQFSKIVIGGLIGVGLFFLDFIPVIVRYPLVFASVSIGVLMAIIPNLGVWLAGILKALFISPRYVWIRQPPSPALLLEPDKPVKEGNQNTASMQTKKKIDITELPLEKLFGTKRDNGSSEDEKDDPLTMNNNSNAKSVNFERVYQSVYGNEIPKATKVAPAGGPIASQKTSTLAGAVRSPSTRQVDAGPNTVINIPKISRVFGHEEAQAKANEQKAIEDKNQTMEDYMNEIKFLKQELGKLSKGSDPAKEQAILSRINTLYNEVKLMQQDTDAPPVNAPTQSRIVGNRVIIEKQEPGAKYVFGIVVDKKDSPIAEAAVQFTNLETGKSYSAVSGSDGRFKTSESLPKGDYDVALAGNGRKFHSYKISVKDEQTLPAYKFREK